MCLIVPVQNLLHIHLKTANFILLNKNIKHNENSNKNGPHAKGAVTQGPSCRGASRLLMGPRDGQAAWTSPVALQPGPLSPTLLVSLHLSPQWPRLPHPAAAAGSCAQLSPGLLGPEIRSSGVNQLGGPGGSYVVSPKLVYFLF